MITKWKLRNFKSFREETELRFAPLTIFAGANSTGKSSWVQAILLICQTLDHRIGSRSVVLNGPLVRSGEFDDLRSFNSAEPGIVIGWECMPMEDPALARPDVGLTGPYARAKKRTLGYPSREVRRVSCQIDFRPRPTGSEHDLSRLQPSLASCQLNCVLASSPEAEAPARMSVTWSPGALEKIPESVLAASGAGPAASGELRQGLEYDVDLDHGSLEEIRELLPTASPVGCGFFHFLPVQLSVVIERRAEVANLLEELLSQQLRAYSVPGRRVRQLEDSVIPKEACDALREALGPELAEPLLGLPEPPSGASLRRESEESSGLTIAQLVQRAQHLRIPARVELRRLLQRRGSDLPETVRDLSLRAQEKLELRELPLPPGLSEAGAYLHHVFTQCLSYLGPLRDEPKALYPLPSGPEATDVGTRGESTASVLDIQKSRPVLYLPAARFVGAEIDLRATTCTLEEAVDDWLRYLGVAESVETQDEGKLGHTLRIRTIGSARPHDMTHAGVGASQILPILVGCLLAEPDTTTLLEQPELHLHPRVQSRLADFFISMILLGKQCVLETHSEYLINRIRYRVAAARTLPEIGERIRIYFVEKRGDASSCREVIVNEYGAIKDWPAGFFDQSQEDAEKIIDAATSKRFSRGGSRKNAERDD